MWIIATLATITKLTQKQTLLSTQAIMYRLSWSISTRLLCFALKTSTVEITWGYEKMLCCCCFQSITTHENWINLSLQSQGDLGKPKKQISIEEKKHWHIYNFIFGLKKEKFFVHIGESLSMCWVILLWKKIKFRKNSTTKDPTAWLAWWLTCSTDYYIGTLPIAKFSSFFGGQGVWVFVY
jgi:hypothetical protein